MQIESPEVQYWIAVYATVFSVLILTCSITLTSYIKDLVIRILAIISLNAFIAFLLNWFVFGKTYIGHTQQEFLDSFIFLGFDKNIFFGPVYFIFALCSFIALLIVLFRKRTKV
ncbi:MULTISPECIES: hypothetical protein [unclassified Acinetobacter]|uniref:hypothetical protein n=1 Tax=unclassified Acinetobacter TaxID=196816 RepID=UPI00124BD07C|nr:MULTISPECIES: hypothetical protein [unclassified Acinetobacter]